MVHRGALLPVVAVATGTAALGYAAGIYALVVVSALVVAIAQQSLP